jgi:hypothetical protein
MTRGLTPTIQTEIGAGDVRPILLFEGQFDGGFVRFWTGYGTLQWASKDWTGAGTLIGISEIEENTEIVATGITVTLAGVDPALVSAVIGEARQNMPGRIWVGFLDGSRNVLADPYLAFRGRLDVPSISDSADGCTIGITYENVLGDLLRPREIRFTDEAQKQLYPTDRGFEYVTKIQDKDIKWTRN